MTLELLFRNGVRVRRPSIKAAWMEDVVWALYRWLPNKVPQPTVLCGRSHGVFSLIVGSVAIEARGKGKSC